MQSIETILWYDGEALRYLESSDLGHAFKWILAQKEGSLMLIAMPGKTGLDFHNELRDEACKLMKWDPNKLKVLGGGVSLNDGKILHRSTYFGEMPKEYQGVILTLLGLN